MPIFQMTSDVWLMILLSLTPSSRMGKRDKSSWALNYVLYLSSANVDFVLD